MRKVCLQSLSEHPTPDSPIILTSLLSSFRPFPFRPAYLLPFFILLLLGTPEAHTGPEVSADPYDDNLPPVAIVILKDNEIMKFAYCSPELGID